jgi:rod shape-determining protein MreC
MERLFNFIYNYRAFFTFLLLESLCFWLLIQNNQYQSTKYFNTSNSVVASISSTEDGIREYFSLRDINDLLSKENTSLRNMLEQRNRQLYLFKINKTDSALRTQYDYVNARVVNNSTKYYKNFITIDRGTNDGLQPGMAVISALGAVGKVKSVSDHYSVVISLLNIDDQISSVIKRTGHFGTVQWEGTNSSVTALKYIPRHVKPLVGDSIVTSGYNAIFPPGIFIGRIKEFKLKEEAPFYDINVELSQDFGKLAFVEVIKNRQRKERDSLERVTIDEQR